MPRRRVVLLLVAALSAACASACTGDGGPAASSETTRSELPATRSAAVTTAPSPTSTAPAPKLDRRDARLTVSIRQLKGGVPPSERARLRRVIGRPIESWIDAGFLAGRYPRTNFGAAFDSWTPGAAALGRQHRAVTTNAALGARLVDVAAIRQDARLFIFASNGRTGGATAKVYLRLTGQRRSGDHTTYTVSGDLYLTRQENIWRIFGYDLHRAVEER